MEIYKLEGKTKEDIIEKFVEEKNITENDFYYKQLEPVKSFFSKKEHLEFIIKEELIEYLKLKIKELLEIMGIESQLEIRNRNESINIVIQSNNNAILIGKNGKTIEALQTIIRQTISNQTHIYIKINLDVANYKEKYLKTLIRVAKQTAKEVSKTKVSAKLDPMNSYERRKIHSILSDFKGVKTVSQGKDPDRYIIIKPEGE